MRNKIANKLRKTILKNGIIKREGFYNSDRYKSNGKAYDTTAWLNNGASVCSLGRDRLESYRGVIEEISMI